MQSDSMIAPCGLDCAKCPIFIAANDSKAAEQLAVQWRADGTTEAKPGWFRCQGCRTDRSVCWSEDCKIYKCCVEDKSMDSCNLCKQFPCQILEEWAEHGDHHRQALDYLKETKKLSD